MRRCLQWMVAGLVLMTAHNGRRADACIHPPKDFDFPIQNGPQRGIVLWDNGRQELVLQPGYTLGDSKNPDAKLEVSGEGLVTAFKSFAWLIPVPNVPDSYKEAGATIFKDMHEFTRVRPRLPELKGDEGPVISGDDDTEDGIKFLEAVNIGDYTIQPIRAKGDAGATELKAWLKDGGYGDISDSTLRWYIQRQWCWLAVRLASTRGLPETADSKPLHLSFKSDRPVFPLKINDGRGEFAAEIWVVTREKLDLAKVRAFGLRAPEQEDDYYMQENRETGFVELPESVQELCRESEDLKGLRLGAIWCYRFSGKGFESSRGEDVGAWLEDLHFALEKDSAPKPATEVKPTPDEPAPKDKPPEEKPPEEKK